MIALLVITSVAWLVYLYDKHTKQRRREREALRLQNEMLMQQQVQQIRMIQEYKVYGGPYGALAEALGAMFPDPIQPSPKALLQRNP